MGPLGLQCSQLMHTRVQTNFNLAVTARVEARLQPAWQHQRRQPSISSTFHLWWKIIAEPPVTSPQYFAAAQEARIITRGECESVAHRDGFRVAMVKAVDTLVRSGAVAAPASGSAGRVVGANVGALAFGDAAALPPGLGISTAENGQVELPRPQYT